jgi:hypothetical protein
VSSKGLERIDPHRDSKIEADAVVATDELAMVERSSKTLDVVGTG